MVKVCVYCGSTRKVADVYYATARELGRLIGERGHTLVYGGTNRGLMGALATSASEQGSRIIEVVPQFFEDCDQKQTNKVIRTENLRERKAVMEAHSDAFVALAGGFGTLDEIADLIASKTVANELNQIVKPLVILNTNDFYVSLLEHFERIFRQNFAAEDNRALYSVASTPLEALEHIESYIPPVMGSKIKHAESS